jgi:sugar O-acyltransferase (sialic acid O-acetyltransferase NeuD family)
MKRLAIIGSGDLAKQIAHHAVHDKHYQIVGCFDDFILKGESSNGLCILGNIESIQDSFDKNIFDVLIIGIGYNHMKLRNDLFNRFEKTIPFGTMIHSSCIIDKSAKLGKGTIIYPGCNIDMNAEIGNNCLIYNGCIIAHDSKVSNNTIFSPGVIIAGFCSIGEHVILGIASVLSDHISITEKVRTGAGTVVVKSIDESGIYVGVPAKSIKA